mmetsp:Transcript_33766/g.66721  ORF Transcript_33766/g.66721 Transcript_33766/m.66721 type:complete len:840 (+) Transcript_33766:439-2958(+)
MILNRSNRPENNYIECTDLLRLRQKQETNISSSAKAACKERGNSITTDKIGLEMSDSKNVSSSDSIQSCESGEQTSLLSSDTFSPMSHQAKPLIDKYGVTYDDNEFMVVRTSRGQRKMRKTELAEVIKKVDHEIEEEEKHEVDLDVWEDALDPPQLRESLPLNVRLYLENHVFGWTHLLSATFGHLAFAIFAYAVAGFIFDWLYTMYLSSDNKDAGVKKEWDEIIYLKTFITLFAGFVALRLVRRQRRVWLRSSYGSKEYASDVVRRNSELEIIDRDTMLGRLRSKVAAHRSRRHLKKIKRATTRMQKKISKIECVSHDQVYITPINKIPYAHGGFFGAAPYMLADPVWVDVLRQLMPDVYCEVAKRIFVCTPRLIHWAENNPVVAAYGLIYGMKTCGRIETLEWDVFLDPNLCECVEHALTELDFLGPNSSEEKEAMLEGRVRLLSMHLLEKMLIAHGSTPQLMMEQSGYARNYVFSRVKRTRRTLGGGIYAEQWLSIFADALGLGSDAVMLGTASSPRNLAQPVCTQDQSTEEGFFPDTFCSSSSDEGNEESPFISLNDRTKEKKTRRTNKAFCSHSILESVRVITAILDHPPSLVLDLKSRYVSKRVWARVIDALRDCGVQVEGVGSFVIEEVRGLSSYTYKPVSEMLFFHSAGDIQNACQKGLIKKNDTVYFNAGSLLWEKSRKEDIVSTSRKALYEFDIDSTKLCYTLQPYAFFKECRDKEKSSEESRPKFPHQHHYTWLSDQKCSTIQDYKEAYELNIGVYAQEFAIDEVAADLLCRFVNEYKDVFNLGFSWGGVNGVTVKGIQPGRFTSTDGFWNQRYLGNSWDPNIYPDNV